MQPSETKPGAICIVVENLPVPLDPRVWCEAGALRDAGYSVSVISPKGKKSCTAKYELLEGIHIYRHRAWEASKKWGYIFEYSYALAAELYLVLKVFARTRFRILQGCNPPDDIFLLALLLKPFGVRFIFDHHDLSPEVFEAKFGRASPLLHKIMRFAERCSFKFAATSIATNKSFKQLAVQRGGKREDDVFVVRNCPDLKTFRRAPMRLDLKHGKPMMVVYVGFMGRQDGVDLLLEAINYIVRREKRQDTHFVLIGGGMMLPELRALVARRKLEDFVTFTGQVSHDEVISYLSNSDVGV